MWLARVFDQKGGAFRRLENPLVSGQAVGGGDTLRVRLVVAVEANSFPGSIKASPDRVRVLAVIAVW